MATKRCACQKPLSWREEPLRCIGRIRSCFPVALPRDSCLRQSTGLSDWYTDHHCRDHYVLTYRLLGRYDDPLRYESVPESQSRRLTSVRWPESWCQHHAQALQLFAPEPTEYEILKRRVQFQFQIR